MNQPAFVAAAARFQTNSRLPMTGRCPIHTASWSAVAVMEVATNVELVAIVLVAAAV